MIFTPRLTSTTLQHDPNIHRPKSLIQVGGVGQPLHTHTHTNLHRITTRSQHPQAKLTDTGRLDSRSQPLPTHTILHHFTTRSQHPQAKLTDTGGRGRRTPCQTLAIVTDVTPRCLKLWFKATAEAAEGGVIIKVEASALKGDLSTSRDAWVGTLSC